MEDPKIPNPWNKSPLIDLSGNEWPQLFENKKCVSFADQDNLTQIKEYKIVTPQTPDYLKENWPLSKESDVKYKPFKKPRSWCVSNNCDNNNDKKKPMILTLDPICSPLLKKRKIIQLKILKKLSYIESSLQMYEHLQFINETKTIDNVTYKYKLYTISVDASSIIMCSSERIKNLELRFFAVENKEITCILSRLELCETYFNKFYNKSS
jgi:hypothetical protein